MATTVTGTGSDDHLMNEIDALLRDDIKTLEQSSTVSSVSDAPANAAKSPYIPSIPTSTSTFAYSSSTAAAAAIKPPISISLSTSSSSSASRVTVPSATISSNRPSYSRPINAN